MKTFKVTRIVKQVFEIQAKDRVDAFDKLESYTPKGYFETWIKSENVVQKHDSKVKSK